MSLTLVCERKLCRVLVCFIGMDGCGKTTHAVNLFEKMQSNGLDCKYIHHTYSLLNYIPSNLRTRLQNHFSYMTGQDTLCKSPVKSSLKLKIIMILLSFVAFIQALIGYIIECRPHRHDLLLIYDRYFYDHIVNYMSVCPEWLIKCYLHLIPTPDMTFLLDVSPNTAYWRKKEASIDFYVKYRQSYLSLIKKLDPRKLIVIGTNSDINKVNSIILNYVTKLISKYK
jgi:thymidylate kinase